MGIIRRPVETPGAYILTCPVEQLVAGTYLIEFSAGEKRTASLVRIE